MFTGMKKVEYDTYFIEYGLYHFRVPTPFQRENAMGLAGDTTTFSKVISHDYKKFYQEIPRPQKNDWLMDHKEYGQTYHEFLNKQYFPIQKGKDIIYIAPLTFNLNDCFDQSFITGLVLLCQSYFYDMKIKILEMSLNLEGVEFRRYEDGFYQLNANTLIEKLFFQMPDDAHCLVCITDVDLYNDVRVIKPRDYIYTPPPYKNDFCYELNSFKHKVGVLSLARFDPLYIIDDPPDSENCRIKLYFILMKRISKMLIKNICHMFGLKNCIFFSCVMNGFNHMSEFDLRPMEICPVCLRKLFTSITRKYERLEEGRATNGFHIIERFRKLLDCLESNFFGAFDLEVKWYKARLASIEKEIYGK